MWLGILALLIGLVVGFLASARWSESLLEASTYVGIALLAAMDSVLGGLRAALEHSFEHRIFLSGLLANTFLAAFFVYIGDLLNMPLHVAAAVAFGVRMFNNLGVIRRLLLDAIPGWRARSQKTPAPSSDH